MRSRNCSGQRISGPGQAGILARQTIRYAQATKAGIISIMSVPTREHYYFAQADKEEMLTNEFRIPVLCSSDLEVQ